MKTDEKCNQTISGASNTRGIPKREVKNPKKYKNAKKIQKKCQICNDSSTLIYNILLFHFLRKYKASRGVVHRKKPNATQNVLPSSTSMCSSALILNRYGTARHLSESRLTIGMSEMRNG